MNRIQVFGSIGTDEVKVRAAGQDLLVGASTVASDLGGCELLLAALGADTINALVAHCRRTGWGLDNAYVELAMHGTAPWQAIGRRIWVDGTLDDPQLNQLREVTEHLPLLGLLHPDIYIRSKVERLRRPDMD